MALNIAVPLSGLGGLSPISPMGIECWENIKILVSPIGSESSGVSSLDSEETKVKPTPPTKPEAIKQELRIYYNGRNVLDLYNNLTNSTTWNFRYSHLPENNISMFLANRSLYSRLGPNGLTPVYTINKCECCDFQYTSDCPNNYLSETSLILSSTTTSPTIYTTAASTKKLEYHSSKIDVPAAVNNNAASAAAAAAAAVAAANSVSLQSTQNVTTAFNQQSFTGFKQQQHQQLINQNKTKYNDTFFKKTNNLTNNNSNNISNYSKFNNFIGNTKNNTPDLTQLASALVAANNCSNSPSNTTPPLNILMGGFGNNNNAIHQNGCNDHQMTNNSKINIPQNFLNNNNNNSFSLSNASNSIAGVNQSVPNNINSNANNSIFFSNNNNTNNKSFTSSSSLFNNNSNSINNSANYSFNANSNTNNYMNSFNSINNNSNNINNNPLTINSQHYGRMYKYF